MFELDYVLHLKRKINLTKTGLKICLVLIWPILYGLYYVTTRNPNFHILTLFKAAVSGLIFMAVICLYNFLRYGLKYLSFKKKIFNDRTSLYSIYHVMTEYYSRAKKIGETRYIQEAEEIKDMSLKAFMNYDYDLDTDLRNLKSGDELEQQVAFFSLSVHAYNNISCLVNEMKEEKDKDIKTRLMMIIGLSGSRVAVKPLIEELKNPDEELRAAAVAMLSNFNFAEAVEAVKNYENEQL